MTDLAESRPLPLPRSRDVVPVLREGALTGFFIAMAFSISATQILLAALGLLAPPWTSVPRGAGLTGGLREIVVRLWADTERLRRHPLTRPFLVFTALTLLSGALSGDPLWSLWIARDTIRIATVYLMLL